MFRGATITAFANRQFCSRRQHCKVTQVFKDRRWFLSQAHLAASSCHCLPQRIRQEANPNVLFHALALSVPNRQ